MGSVLQEIDCPRCGQEATSDFYYKTGEEYVHCQRCGYSYSATIINRDKKLSELTDEDWQIDELKEPYGFFKAKLTDELGWYCGSVETEEAFEAVKEQIMKLDNVEYFVLSRFVDGAIIESILIDNGPKFDSAGFTAEDN